MPKAAAIGAVTKSLVAVTSATRSPRAWWPRTSSRAAGAMRGTMTSAMKRRCAASSVAASRARSGSLAWAM